MLGLLSKEVKRGVDLDTSEALGGRRNFGHRSDPCPVTCH